MTAAGQLDLKLGPILGKLQLGGDSCPPLEYPPPHKASCVMLKWLSVAVKNQNRTLFLIGSQVSEPQIRDTSDKIFRVRLQNWRKEVPPMIGTPMASKDIIYHSAALHTKCSYVEKALKAIYRTNIVTHNCQ